MHHVNSEKIFYPRYLENKVAIIQKKFLENILVSVPVLEKYEYFRQLNNYKLITKSGFMPSKLSAPNFRLGKN